MVKIDYDPNGREFPPEKRDKLYKLIYNAILDEMRIAIESQKRSNTLAIRVQNVFNAIYPEIKNDEDMLSYLVEPFLIEHVQKTIDFLLDFRDFRDRRW